ncbi:CDP-diacylglycerol--serine O-phosphatidyltransferase [Nanoarchaeota archaeon]
MKIVKMLKLADFFTLLNITSGFLSIYFALQNNIAFAMLFLIVAVLFDVIDGTVARFFKSENEFGKQLDSLSDVISFGLAPAIIGLIFFSQQWYGIIIFIIFILSGALRLARFNVSKTAGYEGIPITINGIIIPIFYYLFDFFQLNQELMLIIYGLMAILMISSFKIKKLF